MSRNRRPSVRPRLALSPLEDRAVPAVTAAYAVTSDWGSGFQGQVTLANTGPAAVPFTSLAFTLPANVTSVWDAKVVSHVGTKYTVTNAGWDASIPANGSVAFGFVASPGASTAASGFVLNGTPVDGPTSPPPVSPPPVSPPVSPPPVSPPPVSPPVTTGAVTFRSTGDWGSGMTGEITVKNTGATPVANWSLAFTLPGQISSVWNATVVSHVGTRYTVSPAAWNQTIPVGGSVTVGFSASPGGLTATAFALTTTGGSVSPPPVSPPPVSPPPPAVNHAPVAAADAARTTPGQPVKVSVLANDTDADGDALTVAAVGVPMHGVAVNAGDGTVTYTPAAGFTGTDSFAYTAADGKGGTATTSVTVTVAATPPVVASAWPAQVFAPYVDATLYPTYDFVAAAQATGSKYFTLAFITADPQNRPAWGGYAEYAVAGTDFDVMMRGKVSQLRALGGDVAVSFGGAAGQELAQAITDPTKLAAAYRGVISGYGLTHVDFDIEGAASADKASIDRRWAAVAALQQEAAAAGQELNVRVTLPVLPTGLTADGLYVLQSAKAHGVALGVVNVMAMDYGDSAAPNPAGHMGDYAIQAATSVFNQLGTVYGSSLTDAQKWAMVGITPMIGVNDVTTEVFDQAAARQVEAWAAAHHIGLLSFWSENRDQQNAKGKLNYVDLFSSGVTQTPYEFTGIFKPFTG